MNSLLNDEKRICNIYRGSQYPYGKLLKVRLLFKKKRPSAIL